ncbi:HIRAN domain-containing protein [Reichenbachiella agariperforans]|uniref:HIRAN domain-containing protein n=1 Tax=Reichenbachiella agariperforans TaxID=156994 RepID=UPI001C08B607|nr:HIRAN domain-containing protein [Reichenbachiella agariperforans]MBU2915485.1 hypothetical protein [Reichenbachiella agariperforans]
MKELGNIYLSWREGAGKRRHIVGVIKRNATEGARFEYWQEGLKRAYDDGFTVYTEFPDTTKVYRDNVMDVFGQRIMKTERSDIADFLDFWEIDDKYMNDKYYMLAHTQGLNPTDNFEFLADYHPVKCLRFLTDLASLSISKLPLDALNIGDRLTYRLEPNNPIDRYAVRVLKNEEEIGYIKKIHSRVFHKSKNTLTLEVKAVEKNGAIKRAFVKVSAC